VSINYTVQAYKVETATFYTQEGRSGRGIRTHEEHKCWYQYTNYRTNINSKQYKHIARSEYIDKIKANCLQNDSKCMLITKDEIVYNNKQSARAQTQRTRANTVHTDDKQEASDRHIPHPDQAECTEVMSVSARNTNSRSSRFNI
jgi:hypothetical protein